MTEETKKIEEITYTSMIRAIALNISQIVSGNDAVSKLYTKRECTECHKKIEFINMDYIGADLYCLNCIKEIQPHNISSRLKEIE